jgi:hypothetical protein
MSERKGEKGGKGVKKHGGDQEKKPHSSVILKKMSTAKGRSRYDQPAPSGELH